LLETETERSSEIFSAEKRWRYEVCQAFDLRYSQALELSILVSVLWHHVGLVCCAMAPHRIGMLCHLVLCYGAT